MVLLYMVTFTINICQMLAYIPYMDPMGKCVCYCLSIVKPSRFFSVDTMLVSYGFILSNVGQI